MTIVASQPSTIPSLHLFVQFTAQTLVAGIIISSDESAGDGNGSHMLRLPSAALETLKSKDLPSSRLSGGAADDVVFAEEVGGSVGRDTGVAHVSSGAPDQSGRAGGNGGVESDVSQRTVRGDVDRLLTGLSGLRKGGQVPRFREKSRKGRGGGVD